jgi:rod shape determining protein RodA
MVSDNDSHLDMPLLTGLLLLCGASLVILYSAGGENVELIWRQAVRIGIALIVMLIMTQVSPDTLTRWSPWLYTIGLVSLGLVLGVGIVGKGAQRWLEIGVFRFQPAELMKLGVPMMVAWLVTRNPLPPRTGMLMLATMAVCVPVVMVAVQPDLGTAILIAIGGFLVIFLAGLRWIHITVLFGLAVAAVPYLWSQLHVYQQRRIAVLFDPWQDPLGSGYHTIQAVIAIGSGGLHGKGWRSGTQSQLEFIPERSTDFIYAVFAEEFGLYGGLLLLSLYAFVIWRCMVIAFSARDTYARLLSGSLALTFFFYLFVNIGMVSGILPVVGVPLPLVSYGGTSMVTLMAGFGIMMSIHTRKRLMT